MHIFVILNASNQALIWRFHVTFLQNSHEFLLSHCDSHQMISDICETAQNDIFAVVPVKSPLFTELVEI